MWLSWSLPPDNLWIFDMKFLAVVGGFESIAGFWGGSVGGFLRRVFNNNFQVWVVCFSFFSNLCNLRRAVLLSFLCIFHRSAADSALTEDYSLPGYHTHRRFLCGAGKTDREGGNSRVWERGRIIVPRFRWVQPWSNSWSQVQRWSAGSLAVDVMPCRMPTAAEKVWF